MSAPTCVCALNCTRARPFQLTATTRPGTPTQRANSGRRSSTTMRFPAYCRFRRSISMGNMMLDSLPLSEVCDNG